MADIDVWPISTLLMADMVFCVADMVVADVVCGRYRRFPSTPVHRCSQEFVLGALLRSEGPKFEAEG